MKKVDLGRKLESILQKGFDFYPQLQEEVRVTRGYKSGNEIPEDDVEYRDPLTGEIKSTPKTELPELATDKKEYKILVIRYTEQMSLAPFEGNRIPEGAQDDGLDSGQELQPEDDGHLSFRGSALSGG